MLCINIGSCGTGSNKPPIMAYNTNRTPAIFHHFNIDLATINEIELIGKGKYYLGTL
jgi:hypothetical protein